MRDFFCGNVVVLYCVINSLPVQSMNLTGEVESVAEEEQLVSSYLTKTKRNYFADWQ